MIRIIPFFILIRISLKEKYFLSSFFKVEYLEIFIISIPIFSSALIYHLSFKEFNFLEKFSKVLITIILRTFRLCLFSSRIFNFLFFLELRSFFIVFLVLNLSKDQDKLSSILFIIFFNMLGSLPLFYIFFCYKNSELNSLLNLFSSSSILYFFLITLILARKLPIFFLHFWLTKAHVRASGVCSIILAGLILKLGSIGLIKFSNLFIKVCIKINSQIIRLRIIGMLLLRILIIRFFDLKYFVACSSVVHIALSFPFFLSGENIALLSRIMIIVGHGLVSFFLFFLVSLIYEYRHNRSFDFNKSLESSIKFISFLFFLFLFLNIGVPPFLNFYREVFSFNFLRKNSFQLTFFFFLSILSACLYLIFRLTKQSFRKTEKFNRLENNPRLVVIFKFYILRYIIIFLIF